MCEVIIDCFCLMSLSGQSTTPRILIYQYMVCFFNIGPLAESFVLLQSGVVL